MLVTCPKIEKSDVSDFGKTWEKLVEVTTMYIDCAKRHNALVEFERQKK